MCVGWGRGQRLSIRAGGARCGTRGAGCGRGGSRRRAGTGGFARAGACYGFALRARSLARSSGPLWWRIACVWNTCIASAYLYLYLYFVTRSAAGERGRRAEGGAGGHALGGAAVGARDGSRRCSGWRRSRFAAVAACVIVPPPCVYRLKWRLPLKLPRRTVQPQRCAHSCSGPRRAPSLSHTVARSAGLYGQIVAERFRQTAHHGNLPGARSPASAASAGGCRGCIERFCGHRCHVSASNARAAPAACARGSRGRLPSAKLNTATAAATTAPAPAAVRSTTKTAAAAECCGGERGTYVSRFGCGDNAVWPAGSCFRLLGHWHGSVFGRGWWRVARRCCAPC